MQKIQLGVLVSQRIPVLRGSRVLFPLLPALFRVHGSGQMRSRCRAVEQEGDILNQRCFLILNNDKDLS